MGISTTRVLSPILNGETVPYCSRMCCKNSLFGPLWGLMP